VPTGPEQDDPALVAQAHAQRRQLPRVDEFVRLGKAGHRRVEPVQLELHVGQRLADQRGGRRGLGAGLDVAQSRERRPESSLGLLRTAGVREQ
jgi:hypothetical protein